LASIQPLPNIGSRLVFLVSIVHHLRDEREWDLTLEKIAPVTTLDVLDAATPDGWIFSLAGLLPQSYEERGIGLTMQTHIGESFLARPNGKPSILLRLTEARA
jgi:hypothetical protein